MHVNIEIHRKAGRATARVILDHRRTNWRRMDAYSLTVVRRVYGNAIMDAGIHGRRSPLCLHATTVRDAKLWAGEKFRYTTGSELLIDFL